MSLNLVWAMPTYAGRKSLAAPSNLAASAVSTSQINLTWQDNSSNESGFVIQRASTSTGPWSQIASVGAGVTSYSNTGLNAATMYYYRVNAFNNSGSSTYAGPVSAITAACTDTITTGVSPSGAGTTSGGGTINCSSTVTVSASPSAGYNFASWTENGSVVSSSPSYTFTASANRNLVANFTAVSAGNITNNLVGYWTVDAANVSGTTALDSSGNGNNGTLMGTTPPPLMPGKIAQAVDLTNSSQCVVVQDSASLNLTGPFTVATWVNFASLPAVGQYPNVVAKLASSSAYNGYGLFWNGVGVAGIIGPGSTTWYTTAPYTPTAGVWTHFVTVFDGSLLKLYVNGVQYSQVAASAPGSTATIPIKMGPHYSNPSTYGTINGTLDDVRVYGRALSDTDITQLYGYAGPVCTATITTGSSPAGAGTTSGGGTAACGSPVTVTATPGSGYSFVNWTQNGAVVSTSASYTFSANSSGMLVANFAATPCNYTINTSSSPASGGTTSGGGTVNCGSSVTVTATAASCYHFLNWTLNGTVVSSSVSYTFTANAGQTLVANFAPNTYTIGTGIAPSGAGSVNGGGTVNCGSSITVTATPAAGYNFANWTENGTLVSSSASYSFTANANRTLMANFTAAACNVTVATGVSPAGAGTASGGGTVNCGSTVTVTATGSSCYRFLNWSLNGAVVSSSASYTFTANTSQTLVANFALNTFTIITGVAPSGAGSVSGGGTVNCGSSVAVTATPATGYSFSNWTENGVAVSTAAIYSFTATGNRTLVANFAVVPCGFLLSATSSSASAAGGSASVGVSASASTCSWSASSTYGWLHTSSSATGDGTANFSVDPNPASASRNGSLTIADQTFSVTQAGHAAPTANPGPNQSTSVGTALTFNGSGSSVRDGAVITNYSWGMGDLTYASGISFTHAYSAAGTYTVTLTVIDSFGASSSGSCTISVTNVLCALNPALSSPANGTTVSNTITLSATASTCATRVEFYCDNTVLVGTATTAPYSVSWNTTGAANGSHTLMAKAYDATGNSSTSGGSTVTVNNTSTVTTGGQLQWVNTMLTTRSGVTAMSTGVATDSSGNAITVGAFNNTMISGSITSSSSGGWNSFIAKYTVQGSPVWLKTLGGVGNCYAQAVSVDNQGNIVVVGYFSGTADFGGTVLSAPDPYYTQAADMFVAKYTTTGSLLWVQRFGGNTSAVATGVGVDSSNNILLAGYISSSTTFGSITLATVANNSLVVAKLSSAGQVLWARSWGSSGSTVQSSGLAVDPTGNVAVTGSFYGNTDIGGGIMSASSGSSPTVFLAKYSGVDGSAQWAKGFGGSGNNAGTSVAIDPNTLNVIVSGGVTGTANFGGGSVTGGPGESAFLAGYSSSGGFLWVNTFGGTVSGEQSQINAVRIDGRGNLVFTGAKGGPWRIGGSWVFSSLVAASYTISGNTAPTLRWFDIVGSGTTGADAGSAITFDTFGHVIAAGSFYSGTVNFGGISGTSPSGAYSGWVAQFDN